MRRQPSLIGPTASRTGCVPATGSRKIYNFRFTGSVGTLSVPVPVLEISVKNRTGPNFGNPREEEGEGVCVSSELSAETMSPARGVTRGSCSKATGKLVLPISRPYVILYSANRHRRHRSLHQVHRTRLVPRHRKWVGKLWRPVSPYKAWNAE